jgi:hypothetical protein
MGRSTFSGPVGSTEGFLFPVTTTALLPVLTTDDAGMVYIITDNGAGNNERCIVQWTGSAWVTAVGAALS